MDRDDLAGDASGKRELRVKGPNVTRGYYNNREATAQALDAQGYYRSSDAGAFLSSGELSAGLIFDGRIGEDFKLSNGYRVGLATAGSAVQRFRSSRTAEPRNR